MTPVWHDGALAAIECTAMPVVWSVRDDGPEGRRACARDLVAHLAAVDPARVGLARTPAGAPRVSAPAGWYIGLSRRGGRCLVAAATQPIAVDREIVDDAPPLWDMLTPDEARALLALPVEARPRAWLRRWTIKEAHAKLVGDPRRLAPATIATEVMDAVHATARREGLSRCWTRDTGDAVETVALRDGAWGEDG